MNIQVLIALTAVLFLNTTCPQFAITKTDTAHIFSDKTNFHKTRNGAKVKWSWQLPPAVRNAFNKSDYANCFIEKMIRYDADGETVYRFHVNNGNLLDGDHHDSFFKADSLDITGNGTILTINSLPKF